MTRDFVMSLEEQVRATLRDLLPAMQVDGGGAEIVSLNDGCLVIELIGTCTCCPSRELSATSLADALTHRLPNLQAVRIVSETGTAAEGCQTETLVQIGTVAR